MNAKPSELPLCSLMGKYSRIYIFRLGRIVIKMHFAVCNEWDMVFIF